ncbi:MAG: DUF1587 domain-containing protein [Acidobacteria bacterium]|nr:DUF1587 domain-containing protein [Acidobacteriota bacterium]
MAPIRRLNRDGYSATVRDLLGISLDLAKMLPADGAEGFDNAVETMFLSPLHSENISRFRLGLRRQRSDPSGAALYR